MDCVSCLFCEMQKGSPFCCSLDQAVSKMECEGRQWMERPLHMHMRPALRIFPFQLDAMKAEKREKAEQIMAWAKYIFVAKLTAAFTKVKFKAWDKERLRKEYIEELIKRYKEGRLTFMSPLFRYAVRNHISWDLSEPHSYDANASESDANTSPKERKAA